MDYEIVLSFPVQGAWIEIVLVAEAAFLFACICDCKQVKEAKQE